MLQGFLTAIISEQEKKKKILPEEDAFVCPFLYSHAQLEDIKSDVEMSLERVRECVLTASFVLTLKTFFPSSYEKEACNNRGSLAFSTQ